MSSTPTKVYEYLRDQWCWGFEISLWVDQGGTADSNIHKWCHTRVQNKEKGESQTQ